MCQVRLLGTQTTSDDICSDAGKVVPGSGELPRFTSISPMHYPERRENLPHCRISAAVSRQHQAALPAITAAVLVGSFFASPAHACRPGVWVSTSAPACPAPRISATCTAPVRGPPSTPRPSPPPHTQSGCRLLFQGHLLPVCIQTAGFQLGGPVASR